MINITINRNQLQPFPLRISSLSPDDDSPSSEALSKRNSILEKHTSHQRTYISMGAAASKSSQVEIDAYLFRFLFSIHHTFRLNPHGHKLLHLVCLSREHTVCFLLGCIW